MNLGNLTLSGDWGEIDVETAIQTLRENGPQGASHKDRDELLPCQIRQECDGIHAAQSINMPLSEGVTIHDVVACPECERFLHENAPDPDP